MVLENWGVAEGGRWYAKKKVCHNNKRRLLLGSIWIVSVSEGLLIGQRSASASASRFLRCWWGYSLSTPGFRATIVARLNVPAIFWYVYPYSPASATCWGTLPNTICIGTKLDSLWTIYLLPPNDICVSLSLSLSISSRATFHELWVIVKSVNKLDMYYLRVSTRCNKSRVLKYVYTLK